ncbi:MAG: hypothetical protein ACXIUQ_01690 [Cecembia sp.]
MYRIIWISLLLFGLKGLSFAQDSRPDKIGIGVGPSFLYGDNTGIMSEFKFKILPAVSIDFTKYLDTHFDIRGTVGWQSIGSGDFYTESLILGIAESGYPHAFSGNLFFADVMPTYILNPDRIGFIPSAIKIYGGLGVGVFHSSRNDDIGLLDGELFTTETVIGTNTGVYFPVRVGAYMEVPELRGEIGLEGALLISPFANMEGNSKQQKLVKSDIAVQLQVFYRIYL